MLAMLNELGAFRQQATSLFDGLVRTDDRAVLLPTQVLARLSEATNS